MEENAGDLAELRKEFHNRKKEVLLLRSQLNSLQVQKEEIYGQLHTIDGSIKSSLTQIASLKQERDELTKKVKELKQERDKSNAAVQEKSALKKEADQKKKELSGELNLRDNSGKIKSLIYQLEQKLETEVMPFPKEEQIRKKIKELQAQHKRFETLRAASKNLNTAAADVAVNRRKAEQFHREVQETAVLSQNKHEQLKAIYGEIKKLRETEKPLWEKYLGLKAQYEQIKKSFEETLSKVKELSALFSQEETKSFKEQMREKTAQVAEKIKKKEKLNIDDILAFQASEK